MKCAFVKSSDTSQHTQQQVVHIKKTGVCKGTFRVAAVVAARVLVFYVRRFGGAHGSPRSLYVCVRARVSAQRRAHTLKSLAASIGMARIAHQAEGLESQIRKGTDAETLQPALLALEHDLQAFVQELALQLPQEPAHATLTEAVDAQALAQVCSHLALLLADDNLEAVECLAENQTLLGAALGEHYAAIADAVRRFDCALALARLRIAAQSLGIAMTNPTGNP